MENMAEKENFLEDDGSYLLEKERPMSNENLSQAQAMPSGTMTTKGTMNYVIVNECRNIESLMTQKSSSSLNAGRSYGTLDGHKRSVCENEPLLGGSLVAVHVEHSRFLLKIKKEHFFFYLYVIFFFGYLVFGSLCFQTLETDTELDVRHNFRDARKQFLSDHPSVSGNWFVLGVQYRAFHSICNRPDEATQSDIRF